jgi:hypothetical protein
VTDTPPEVEIYVRVFQVLHPETRVEIVERP